MSGLVIGDPGGVRDDENHMAPDAPGLDIEKTPAGMDITFQTPSTDGAVHPDDPIIPPPEGAAYDDAYNFQQPKVSFEAPPLETRRASFDPASAHQGGQQPKQFREQFDGLMTRLEDRFQNERLNLEEKHSRELEEAMGYFSLSTVEREAKQEELQTALLEDIGNMAQQLNELTGTLGTEGDGESLTIPSDPRVLEEYARKMQDLEDQFHREKEELEAKQANDMERALGTLKLSREQREAKQLQLQDQLSAEVGDMTRQLEELNQAKHAYESKMGIIKKQLSKEEPFGRTAADPKLQSMNRRLSDVERERDAAQEELRRLKLALQVTQSDGGSSLGKRSRGHPPSTGAQDRRSTGVGKPLSPQEQNNISSLRGRIEQIEKKLKEAPGVGSETMKGLRERMKRIESDLEAAEESTKEHFAMEHLRARMKKVERLLTEGERAAKDWEELEQLRDKIGNVDQDLKAVEEAKKEFEALEALRSKLESVEKELRAAERLATDRENVEQLRNRLAQVERELGVVEPSRQESTSIDKLLTRLAKAEKSLQDARESTRPSDRPSPMPVSASRGFHQKTGRDEEAEKILRRLALAESKLNAAKESAQRRNPEATTGLPSLARSAQPARTSQRTPFDERQAKIRARLQEHFDESAPSVKDANSKKQYERQQLSPRSMQDQPMQDQSNRERIDRPQRSKFEEPRTIGGSSKNRYYVQDVQLERDMVPRANAIPRTTAFEDETIPTQEPPHFDDFQDRFETDFNAPTTRPLRRRRAGEPSPERRNEEKSIDDGLGGAASRPLRRRYSGVAPETVAKPSRPEVAIGPSYSMAYSVLGEDEDRYVADLEELRYQRALLSQKLPKNRRDEEEKKSEDNSEYEPKYSFKKAIRDEEKQLLRQRMNPRLHVKKPTDGPRVPADPKEIISSPVNADSVTEKALSPPAHAVTSEPEMTLEPAESMDDTQSAKTGASAKTGVSTRTSGDPPTRPGRETTDDPPSQVPSLETELKKRLMSQTNASGRDPNPGNTRLRTTQDPPAHVDPPLRLQPLRQMPEESVFSSPAPSSPSAPSAPSTPFAGIPEKEHPSDEKSEPTSVKEPETLEQASTYSSKVPSSMRQDASVESKSEQENSKNSWKDASAISVASSVTPSVASARSPASKPPVPPPPRQSLDPSPIQQQSQEPPAAPLPPPPPARPPPPPPPHVPQPPPSPAFEEQKVSVPQRDESHQFPTPPPPGTGMSNWDDAQQFPSPPTHTPGSPDESVSASSVGSVSSSAAPPPAKRVEPLPPQQLQLVIQDPNPQMRLPPQQPIFHQTTVVDGKAAARERMAKDRLMRWVILILLCVAIILAVVIIVAIVLLRDNNDEKIIATSAPTVNPIPPAPPTVAPSMMNTMNGTSMTFAPTMDDEAFRGCPPLKNNVPLVANGMTTDENTISASYDGSTYESCGNIDQAGDNGVWYALIGEGDVVTVSTCTLFFPSFDTQIVVYTPVNQTQGCFAGMECVASNDNFCGLQSSVTFIAQDDTLYFIYVNGLSLAPAEGFNATEGEFSLTVSTSPEGSCQGASYLEIGPADLLPVIVVDQLIGGTFGVDPCNPELETRTGELWYKVVGTGQVAVASTCHGVSHFSARLAVYQGFCDDLICITSEDEDCGNGNQITWFAQAGVEYYLLVYTPMFVPDSTFGISVQEII